MRLISSETTDRVLGAAIEVHRILGPGLLESAYEECLCDEFCSRDIPFRRQVHLPVDYKGKKLDCGYRMDLVVESLVVVEVKAVEEVLPVHLAQLLTSLRHGELEVGLLLNFNVARLSDGIHRRVLTR